ncbi:MAG: inorganic phosphate transporter, partial [Bacteroidales bacterium]
VAMGSSLSDQAWGRESAVYRITGVITVIGGWFFTAFTAFVAAFVFAWFISWGGVTAAVAALALAFFFLIRTYYLHKKRSAEKQQQKEKELRVWNGEEVLHESHLNVTKTLETVASLYATVFRGYVSEDRKLVKNAFREVEELNLFTKELKRDVFLTLKRLEGDSVDTGHYYVQTLDYLREIAHSLTFFTEPILQHLENNHPTIISEQEKELLQLESNITALFQRILNLLQQGNFTDLENIILLQGNILDELDQIKKRQIKLIKNEKVRTRGSMLLFNSLAETKNLLLFTINLLKAQRDFLSQQ